MALLHRSRSQTRIDFFASGAHLFLAILICAILLVSNPGFPHKTRAQTKRPTLISQDTSTRAIAVDSITQTREPFALNSAVSWGNDNRTRIMLFAMDLSLQ